MKVTLTEYVHKLGQRPLLMPVLLLFIILLVRSIFAVKSDDLPYGTYKLTVNKVDIALDGSSRIYGSSDRTGRVIINTEKELYPGDIIETTCRPLIPEGSSNPGQFDYKRYLRTKGIGYSIISDDLKVLHSSHFGAFITRVRYFIRNLIYQSFADYYEDKDTALMSALCLGDTSLVDDQITRNFRLADCSHLLAVSGTHFSSFLVITSYCLKGFDGKRRNFFQTIVIMILGFLTGWTESVTRSAFMSLCTLNSRDSLSGMCFAAVIMMLSDPFCVRSTGFLMSFGAALGIRFLSAPIEKYVRSSVIAATLASKTALLPFYLENGFSIGLIHFAMQLLALLCVKVVCLLFVSGVILSFVSPVFYYPAIIFAKITDLLTQKGADSYFDCLTLHGDLKISIILTVLILGALVMRKHRYTVICITVFILVIFLAGNIDLSDKVIFLDVGQGDSCLILTDDVSILIDGGTEENGKRVLPDVLDHYKIRNVDIAVITHFDEDHEGGIRYLQDLGRVKKVIRSSKDLISGDHMKAGNASFDVIWPESFTDGNPGSIVCIADIQGIKILLTGDADVECEEGMSDRLVDVDILKVAHHGSKYSTSMKFLETIKPEIAVISVALKNIYGHPAPEVMDRLGEVEANIYQTSKNGAIIVTINDENYEITCFKE